jgi:hypothetical protein
VDVGERPPILQQQGSAKDALDEICEISRKTERIIYLKSINRETIAASYACYNTRRLFSMHQIIS